MSDNIAEYVHRFMDSLRPTRWLIDDGFISKPFTLDNMSDSRHSTLTYVQKDYKYDVTS